MERKPIWSLSLCLLSLMCGCVAAKLAAHATIAYRSPGPQSLAEQPEFVQISVPSNQLDQMGEPTQTRASEPTVLVAAAVSPTIPALRQ